MMSNLPILTFFAILAIGNHPSDGGPVSGTSEFQPEFTEALENVTVAIGRDATFTCVVRGLGGYRVGWVRADSKAIQAIHNHVITHNPRVSVTHSDHSMWHLHIKGVKEEDRGSYMCQINTDPMISQVAMLEVVIPPEFIPEETSGDIMAPEGSTVKLTCKARGHPTPAIKWRREDGQNITLKTQGSKTQVPVLEGDVLKLQKISRADMGTYLCIASNAVPPSISKRITVSVHFHPVIHVPNQLVGAPLNTAVTLECNVEAYPRSIHFWVKDQGGAMIIDSDRHDVQEITKSMFEVKMVLIIQKFQKDDAGSYHCIAKNSLGDVDSVVKLHELKVGKDSDDDRPGLDGGRRNGLDYDDNDLDPGYYEMGERDFDMDTTTISRNNNKNRHTYTNVNRNSVVVGAGGGRGVTATEDQSGGSSSNSGGNGSGNSSNRKHNNYTPGGERERITGNGGSGRAKGNNEGRRQTKRPGHSSGGKNWDSPNGSDSHTNQSPMVPYPDGSATPRDRDGSSSSAAKLFSTRCTNHHHPIFNHFYNLITCIVQHGLVPLQILFSIPCLLIIFL